MLTIFFSSSSSLLLRQSRCSISQVIAEFKKKIGGGVGRGGKSFLAEIMVVICGCGDHERAGVVAWLSSVCSDVFYDREMMFFQDG